MIKKILENDYVFSIITKISMIFIAFFHSIVLARYLGSELKGIHATIYSIMAIGAVIINMSSQQAYPYFRKKYGYENYFDKFMSFTYIYHIAFIILAILVNVFHNFGYIIATSIILIPISSFSTVLGYITLVENPRNRNKALLIIDIIDIVILLIMWLGIKANINIILFVLMSPLLLRIIYFSYKNKFKFSVKCCTYSFIKELFGFSLFPMISMLLTMLNYKIDIFMLKMDETISLSLIGVYSIGVSLADKVVYIPDAVKEILLSKLAKGSGKEEVLKTMRFCFPISLLLTMCVIVLGEPVINFLYGAEYTGAYLVTVICVFGTSMMVFFKMISQYNNVNGKQKVNVIILFISVIINIILNYIYIPKYNIIGAAIASLISYSLCAIMFMLYFKKVNKVKIRNMFFPTKDDFLNIKKKIIVKEN